MANVACLELDPEFPRDRCMTNVTRNCENFQKGIMLDGSSWHSGIPIHSASCIVLVKGTSHNIEGSNKVCTLKSDMLTSAVVRVDNFCQPKILV